MLATLAEIVHGGTMIAVITVLVVTLVPEMQHL